MKNTCRALLVFIFTYSQAFAAGPVIWNGTRSKALTQKGFVLSDSSVVDNDGQLNYVKNGHGEVSATGWTTYDDGAATPVDCTGGTVSETITKSSTTPLVGAGSLLLTKDAANRQGEGAAYNFTIDNAYKSTPLQIKVTALGSANYAASDIGIYVYDVTNAQLLTPAAVNIAAGTFTLNSFFVATTSTSYRLCVHTQSTNASAYTLQLDSVSVGPYSVGVGFAGTDWIQNTGFTVNGFNTVTNTRFYTRRVGDSLQVIGYFQAASGAASTASVSLPSGLTIDNTKVVPSAANTYTLGPVFRLKSGSPGASAIGTVLFLDGSTTDRFFFSDNGALASTEYLKTNGSNIDAGSDAWSFGPINIPIANWNSGTQLADRAVEEYASNSSTTVTDDTTSFAYGPFGSFIPNGSAAGPFKKTVRFQYPVQTTDSLIVELQVGGSNQWVPVSTSTQSTGIGPFLYLGGASAGIGVNNNTGSTTDINVFFGRYANYSGAGSFGSGGDNWSTFSASKWRLRKISGGALVGYPQSTDNILGSTTGLAPADGYIGQQISSSQSGIGGINTGVYTTIQSIVLTPGIWDINATTRIPSQTVTNVDWGIATTTNSNTGWVFGDNANSILTIAGQDTGGTIVGVRVNVPSTTTYYLTMRPFGGNITAVACRLSAVRVH